MDTRTVLERHLAAFLAGDVDAVADDYADDALFMTPERVVRGREDIRAALAGLLTGLFAPGTYEFTLDGLSVDGEIGQVVWHASCKPVEIPFATDTFVVRNGKIDVQTVALKVEPK